MGRGVSSRVLYISVYGSTVHFIIHVARLYDLKLYVPVLGIFAPRACYIKVCPSNGKEVGFILGEPHAISTL